MRSQSTKPSEVWRPSGGGRRSLRRTLVWAAVGLAALAVAIFTATLLFWFHSEMHEQVDSMLIELATTEAESSIREMDSIGLHVHDTPVGLPSAPGNVARRYGLAFDEECRVLTHTENWALDEVPRAWCERPLRLGEAHVFDIDGVGGDGPELRAASFVALRTGGEPAAFVVGIEHDSIDDAVWSTLRVAIVLGLVLLVVTGVTAGGFAGRLTRDLSSLRSACERVELGQADLRQASELFTVSKSAPDEVQTLAQTIRALIGRIDVMLESQSRFVAEAAHELRTPLTALQGELELALRRERSGSEYREALETALDDARRLKGLSDELLEAARAHAETVTTEPASLRSLVDASVARMSRQLEERGIDVDVRGRVEARALLDPMSASRVVDNLLQNAIVHGEPGHIAFEIRQLEESGPSTHLSGRPDEWVELWVRDDGIGVPDDLEEHLFTPFQKASSGEGHGLGLFIARDLMRRQRGDLCYADADPAGLGGASFRLRFRPAG